MASLIGSGGGIADFFPKKCPLSKPPVGYVSCNGDKIDPVTQPVLFSIYGVSLPDMRGLVVRGLDDGKGRDPERAVLSFQSHSVESHSHSINSFNYGIKESSDFYFGRKWTNTVGNHDHGFQISNQYGNNNYGGNKLAAASMGQSRAYPSVSQGGINFTVNGAGTHNHYLDLGAHGHTVNIGSHSHVIGSFGANETRMMNIAMLFIVKNG
ncbi:hypothetical protein C0Z01_14145 [Photobacterium kishitanii]|uniref:phage tail protein n=1 Tax=Photobacterium kishitanii TaxID=318456 RepID=UPI0007EF6036|nr:phage tail protein [Photobacterium kishitanii]OBU24951.1 hypothetical protein AYY22_20990 [Photobacterium kishitanii]PSW68697.1 hypothetical protein C0Z01_14145 [Photobacterium kishitanii]